MMSQDQQTSPHQIQVTVRDGLLIPSTMAGLDENGEKDPVINLNCYTQQPRDIINLRINRSLIEESGIDFFHPRVIQGYSVTATGDGCVEKIGSARDDSPCNSWLSVSVHDITINPTLIPIPAYLQAQLNIRDGGFFQSDRFNINTFEKQQGNFSSQQKDQQQKETEAEPQVEELKLEELLQLENNGSEKEEAKQQQIISSDEQQQHYDDDRQQREYFNAPQEHILVEPKHSEEAQQQDDKFLEYVEPLASSLPFNEYQNLSPTHDKTREVYLAEEQRNDGTSNKQDSHNSQHNAIDEQPQQQQLYKEIMQQEEEEIPQDEYHSKSMKLFGLEKEVHSYQYEQLVQLQREHQMLQQPEIILQSETAQQQQVVEEQIMEETAVVEKQQEKVNKRDVFASQEQELVKWVDTVEVEERTPSPEQTTMVQEQQKVTIRQHKDILLQQEEEIIQNHQEIIEHMEGIEQQDTEAPEQQQVVLQQQEKTPPPHQEKAEHQQEKIPEMTHPPSRGQKRKRQKKRNLEGAVLRRSPRLVNKPKPQYYYPLKRVYNRKKQKQQEQQ